MFQSVLNWAHAAARPVLYKVVDPVAVTGALTSPAWWSHVDDIGHAVMIALGVVSLLLTIALKIRDLRRPPK